MVQSEMPNGKSLKKNIRFYSFLILPLYLQLIAISIKKSNDNYLDSQNVKNGDKII